MDIDPPFNIQDGQSLPTSWTAHQIVIRNFLAAHAPHLIEMYRILVMSLSMPSFPYASRTACHFANELFRCVIDVLNEEISPGRYNYSEKIGEIAAQLGDNVAVTDGKVTVPLEAHLLLQGLIRETLARKQHKPSLRFIRGVRLGTETDDEYAPVIDRLDSTNKFFNSHRHVPSEPQDPPDIASVREKVLEMEQVLASFLGGSTEDKVALDAWLQTQDPNYLEAALARTAVPSLQRHFWTTITSPALIQPLRKLGLFQIANVVPRGDGRTSIPRSSSFAFLAKHAGMHPDLTVEIFQEAQSTDNPLYVDYLLEALPTTPAQVMAQLSGILCKKLRAGVRPFIESRITTALLALLECGLNDEAIELVENITFLSRDGEDSVKFPVFDEHDLRSREMAQVFEILTQRNPQSLVKLLAKRLDRFMQMTHPERLLDASGHRIAPDIDYSIIWKPTIEDEPGESLERIGPLLVSLLAKALNDATRNGSMSVIEACALLQKFSWPVFTRIEVYLVSQVGSDEMARSMLLNRALFGNINVKHEMFTLFRSRFGQMGPEDRAIISGWIEDGPEGSDS